ncbi:MAG: hypothetical protein O2890_09545 [Cyanobacteria bacterium]|nr:hypothetical protein [Cyanobacteriota bacterium]MDA0866646.1 hypothetical protein [Cyanobacteriota bacterium]
MTLQAFTPMQALRRSLQMVFQAAPIELRRLAWLNLLTGIGPSVSLFLGKVVIDEASALVSQGTLEQPLAALLANRTLLWSLVIALGLNLVVDSVDAVGSSLFASLRDRVEGFVRGKVLEKVAYFDDIALFETPELLNLLELTEKGLGRIQRLSFIVAATFMGVFTFIPSVLVSGSIGGWVPLALIASAIPSIFVEMRHHKKAGGWRKPRPASPARWAFTVRRLPAPTTPRRCGCFPCKGCCWGAGRACLGTCSPRWSGCVGKGR